MAISRRLTGCGVYTLKLLAGRDLACNPSPGCLLTTAWLIGWVLTA